MKKKLIASVISVLTVMTGLTGCAAKVNQDTTGEGKIKVVATLFPQYDFAKEIGGEKASVTMLMAPGVESHTYDPSPADIIKIDSADLFIYTGENMESWSHTIIDGIDTKKEKVLDVSKGIELKKSGEHEDEEHEEEEENHEHTYDPHIWTSPMNAVKMVDNILTSFIAIDPDNSAYYTTNAETYKEKLAGLDNGFREVMAGAQRNKIVVADRFAMLYFADEYGINWEAAIDSCAEDAEPSVKVKAKLIDDIKNEKIPVIYCAELSNRKVADSIAEETGAEVRELHSCHTVSKQDFDNGVTYLDLMNRNLENLKAGVN